MIRPALADREGRALFIGTPKSRNHLYDLYCAAKFRENWATFRRSTKQDGYVPPAELATLEVEMDPQLYAQEFCTSFEGSQARVYHGFDLEKNVIELMPSPYAPLLIGMDFNINSPWCKSGFRNEKDCLIHRDDS